MAEWLLNWAQVQTVSGSKSKWISKTVLKLGHSTEGKKKKKATSVTNRADSLDRFSVRNTFSWNVNMAETMQGRFHLYWHFKRNSGIPGSLPWPSNPLYNYNHPQVPSHETYLWNFNLEVLVILKLHPTLTFSFLEFKKSFGICVTQKATCLPPSAALFYCLNFSYLPSFHLWNDVY